MDRAVDDLTKARMGDPPALDRYTLGWGDGCQYGERIAHCRGLIAGVFIGLAVACVIAALVIHFGGLQ